jgi:beta-mannosidase
LRALPSSPDDEPVQHRQRAWEGARKLRERLAARLPPPADWDQWLYATQWLQAQAVERALVWLRVQRPRCAGALVWQWNDCWPGLSWSAVDAGERPKLAWYAVRRGFLARRLVLAPGLEEGEGLCLYALNDTDQAWEVSAQVARVDREGEVLAQARLELRVEAQGVARVAVPPALGEPGEARREFLWAQASGVPRVTKFFLVDRDFDWPVAHFELSVSSSALSQEVRVEARGLLRGFALDVSRLDPGASAVDAGVVLLPGEVWSCVVHAPRALGAEELAGVARCVNGLGRGAGEG